MDAEARLEIERRLRALTRSTGALRVVMAEIACRLVARRAWERLGYARLSDYADERMGRSARAVQDLARVGHALMCLPRLRAALAGGRLGWTKTRLVARVATPNDEARWIAHAVRVTSDALSREVRRVDRGSVEAGALEEDRSRSRWFEVACTPRTRAAWAFTWSMAARVHGGRLTQSECMEMVAAEVLSALPLERDVLEPDGVDCEETSTHDGASWSEACREAGGGARGEADARRGADTGARREAEAGALRETETNLCRQAQAGAYRQEEAGTRWRAEAGATVGSLAPAAYPPGAGSISQAEAASLEDEAASTEDWTPGDGAATGNGATAAPLPFPLESLVWNLDDADAFELDLRLRAAFAMELRLDARIGPLLHIVVSRRIYVALGYVAQEAYVRERLGLEPSWARSLLRIERAARTSPEFARAYRSGKLTALQARTLVPLVLADLSERATTDWVARAERYTLRRLRDDVEQALVVRETHFKEWQRTGGLPTEEEPGAPEPSDEREIRAQASAPEETSVVRIILDVDVARLMRALLCTVRRRMERVTGRLATPGEAFLAMLHHALEAWGAYDERIPRNHAVFARDGWRCVVPGCTSMRNLHDHHIVFRSVGGPDDPTNRVTLCAFHHLRGVHAGIVRCTGRAPEGLRFALGLRPDGPPLAAYASGDRRLPSVERPS